MEMSKINQLKNKRNKNDKFTEYHICILYVYTLYIISQLTKKDNKFDADTKILHLNTQKGKSHKNLNLSLFATVSKGSKFLSDWSEHLWLGLTMSIILSEEMGSGVKAVLYRVNLQCSFR